MGRSKRSELGTKAKRLALPISKNPVFEVLSKGISVGYRRCDGAGTWVARRSDGNRGKLVKRIGIADDYEDADGIRVLSWSQAQLSALQFDPVAEARIESAAAASEIAKAALPAPTSIAAALDQYEADLRTRGGDTGNIQRLRAHVHRNLLDKAVTELTTADLREWRDKLAAKLTAATANRTCNAFKAALNLAAVNDERIISRNAWEKGLAAIPDAEVARNVILTDESVKKVIDAAYRQSCEFGMLVEVAAVTGARYSQIAGLTVGDLQDGRENPRLIMPSAKKGKGVKKVLRRPVPIPVALAMRLRDAVNNRPTDSPLLLKPQRPQTKAERKAELPAPPPSPWSKSDHYRPFKLAVAVAFTTEGEERTAPTADQAGDNEQAMISIYALRHSSIVRQILSGVPVRVTAILHDTSVAMIEKNYSSLLSDHSDTIARAAMLDVSPAI